MRLLLVALGLLLVGAPARACDRATMRAALDRSFEAWRDRDQTGFRAAREAALASLACQSELLPRDLVRDVHVSTALSAYLPPRDEAAVEQAFRSALAADPGFALDADLAPPGNLLQTLLEQARVRQDGPDQLVGAQEGCTVLVDGREAVHRRQDRPVVLQESCADRVGAVALVPAGEMLPRWAKEPPARVAPEPAEPLPVDRDTGGLMKPWWSLGLGVTGGAALATAGGLYLGARAEQREYASLVDGIERGDLPPGRAGEVDAARNAANGLGVGAQVAAGVGAALLTSALVVRF